MNIKVIGRLIPYAKPIHHFLPEYIVYTILGIIFGIVNFVLLIPMLDVLLNHEAVKVTITEIPKFQPSVSFLKELFNYWFVHIIINYGKFNALLFVCGIVTTSILLANLFKYLAVRVLIRLRLKLMSSVRSDLFNKYLSQSLEYHHNTTKGELIMLMTSEVQEIENSIVNSLQVALRDPFMVIAYFAVLFYMSAKLTLFTLCFLPISGIAIASITRKLKKLSYFSQDTMSLMLSFTSEVLSGIRQIQIFTAEVLTMRKFNTINNSFSKNSRDLFSKKELASPISEVLGVMAALTLIAFGGYLIIYNKTTLTGTAFITYLAIYTQMIQPLKNISQITGNLQRGIAACERIFGFIDTEPTIKDKPNPIKLEQFEKGIEISNINFAYETKDVISNFSLSIPKNKCIAIVGSSGSGKSTLVDLICRFYDVQSGSIKLDGKDIKDLSLESLREKISFVSQNTFLFNDTIANNISFGSHNRTKEQIINAAKISNAHNFIEEAENGYDTVIGETGIKLSGGQRQRISIARAILKDAPILILDEATSALDTESERLVQDAIEKMTKDKTSIIIAHRLSTVKHADEIIVIDAGRIKERGTHSELLEQNGIYKKLVEMQEIN